MKKLSHRYWRWMINRTLYESRKRHQQRSGNLQPRYGTFSDNDGTRIVRLSRKAEIPSTLCLDSATENTLEFFYDLRNRTLKRRNTVPGPTSKRSGHIRSIRSYADFVPLRDISPGAALILAAEYDRIRRTAHMPAAAIDIDRWDETVYRSLRQLGFFKLLGFTDEGLRTLPQPTAPDGAVLMPMVCGNDTDLSDAGDGLLELFTVVGGDNTSRVQLLGAVADAIENVKGHAYQGVVHPGIPHLWWLSGSADAQSRTITLSIYDQGVTIPVTLPNKWSPELISSMIRSFLSDSSATGVSVSDRDDLAVAASMRMSKTSTDAAERGKGLSKIREAVANCAGGRLRVISRRGNYLYEDGVESVSLAELPLRGTYVGIEATFAASN